MVEHCPSEQELSAIFTAGLSQEAHSRIERHLVECADCRSLMDHLSDDPSLNAWIGDTPHRPNLFPFLSRSSRRNDLGSISRYRIEAEIGRGGMGIVFRAWDEELRRFTALKVMRFGGDDAAAKERFMREAKAAGQVRHDHLVPILDVTFTDDHRPVIVMPLVVGQTLRARIRESGALPPRDAAIITRQIAESLAAIHTAGLVHRDVKPGNILLDSSDTRAKLSDFGLSRELMSGDTLTQEGVIVGTPEYLSPEQASSRVGVDHRADIYSLGVTLYECLTGVVPFRGSPLDIIQNHQHDEPVPPRRLSSIVPFDLETISLKCLAKSPDRRYQSAIELRDDLDRWLENRSILARRAGLPERSIRWCQRNPWPVLVMVVSVTGFVVAAMGWWKANQNSVAAERATDQAIANAERANLATQSANENAQLADDRAMLTLNAINTLLVKSQNLIGNTPGTLELKKQLTEAALVELHKLNDAVRRVPGVANSTIDAHRKLGGTFQILGQTDEAMKNWLRAIELAEIRLAAVPDDEATKRNLAGAYSSMGFVEVRLGKFADAARHGDEAIRILEPLALQYAKDPRTKSHLAILYSQRADTAQYSGDQKLALEYFSRGVELLKQAIVIDKSDPKLPAELFTITGRLGYVHMARYDYVAAETGFRDLLVLANEQLERNPDDPVWIRNRQMIQLDLSSVLQRLGRAEESEAMACLTLEPLKNIAAGDPGNSIRQREVAVVHEHIANAQLIAGKLHDAEESFQSALKITESIITLSPQSSQFVMDLFSLSYALALVSERQGKYEQAALWLDRYAKYYLQINGTSASIIQQQIFLSINSNMMQALKQMPRAMMDPRIIEALSPEVEKKVIVFRAIRLGHTGNLAQAEMEIAAARKKYPQESHLLLCEAILHGLAVGQDFDGRQRQFHIDAGASALIAAIKMNRSLLKTVYLYPEIVPIHASSVYRGKLQALLN